jgi:hypothetical protein
MHIIIGPTKTTIETILNLPGTYACAFYPKFLDYSLKIEHKLACYFCFKQFQQK